MRDRLQTSDGTPVGGWVLRGDSDTFDVSEMIERYGQVFRYPVEPGERAELMEPGQPCFLYLTDTSRVVGLWGVGEVVAPVLPVQVDPSDPDSDEILFAEVEMFLLRKPIASSKLRDEALLASSEVFTDPDRPNPLVLEPRAVRVVEGFELDLVTPTDEQSLRLAALLAAEEWEDPDA